MATPKSKEWLAGVEMFRRFMVEQTGKDLKYADSCVADAALALAESAHTPETPEFAEKRYAFKSAKYDKFKLDNLLSAMAEMGFKRWAVSGLR